MSSLQTAAKVRLAERTRNVTLAEEQDSGGTTLDATYQRYYDGSADDEGEGWLKYSFGPAAFERLKAAYRSILADVMSRLQWGRASMDSEKGTSLNSQM